jgi:hypothetical protein
MPCHRKPPIPPSWILDATSKSDCKGNVFVTSHESVVIQAPEMALRDPQLTPQTEQNPSGCNMLHARCFEREITAVFRRWNGMVGLYVWREIGKLSQIRRGI